LQQYIQNDAYFNQKHSEINNWLKNVKGHDERTKAVSIYYLVRDGIKYDPFTLLDGAKSLSSDYCLDNKAAFCIPKASLQIALSRAINIPARLGLADVRNHLSTPKLDKLLKNDVFTMHAYVEQFIEGKWVKSTPAFNKELCDLVNIKPLEFDGVNHSLFHQFTADGKKHMEYLKDHGQFEAMPTALINKSSDHYYPHLALDFSNICK
jgi:hypothetical protein